MSFVSFNQTGSRIATDGPTENDDVSNDLTIWSFPGGKLLKRLPGRPEAVSPRWHYYATQNGVRSMANGALIVRATDYSVQAFSADERFVVQSNEKVGTRIVNLHRPAAVRKLGRHQAFSLAVDATSSRIAAGYWNSVGLWDAKTGALKIVLHGVGRYVDGVSFSPAGSVLAVATDLGEVQLWSLATNKRLRTISIGGGQVSIPAFSPDGRLLAVGVYGTGTVWLIEVRSGRIMDRQKVSDLGCGSAAFSPDGRYLITPSTGGLITWPHDNGGKTRVFKVTKAVARSGVE
jgi:WD40 repeat protein